MFILLRNFSPSLEADKRLETLVKGKINADILIFGSSRGARNVIAEKISDITGKSCFNLSYPGSDISFQEFLLTQLLKNNNKKPAMAILVVDDPFEILPNQSTNFRFDRLYPLVKYKTIRETLIEKGEKNRILSAIFILHQLTKSNFDIRKKKFSEKDTILECGSMPISFQSSNYKFLFGKNDSYNSKNESGIKLMHFLRFIELCKINKIELIISFPPNFQNPNADFEKRIVQLSNRPGVYYFHYDTTKMEYLDKRYYYDISHLNYTGAEIFTNEICNYIMKNSALKTPYTVTGYPK